MSPGVSACIDFSATVSAPGGLPWAESQGLGAPARHRPCPRGAGETPPPQPAKRWRYRNLKPSASLT